MGWRAYEPLMQACVQGRLMHAAKPDGPHNDLDACAHSRYLDKPATYQQYGRRLSRISNVPSAPPQMRPPLGPPAQSIRVGPALIAAMLVIFALSWPVRASCGIDDAPCVVPLGEYRVMLPASARPVTGFPAVMFFHGYGASALQTLRNKAMVDTFLARGYALIAPEGTAREGMKGRTWSFHPHRFKARDEMAFTRQVLGDASARHGVDRKRILLSGFSIGGSLTWYLACQDPGLAAAFAPVAGAFWRPHPARGTCAGPVRLLHTHGWRDETVPLEGRVLRNGTLLQGDVFHGLELLRDLNRCDAMRADAYETDGAFWRRWWTRCAPNSRLELALHTQGHMVPPGWAEMAIDWFEREVINAPRTAGQTAH